MLCVNVSMSYESQPITSSVLMLQFFSVLVFSLVHIGVEIDLRLWDNPVQASQRKIPILVDAEKKREGLDDLLNFASYVVCSAKFPQVSFLFPTTTEYYC